MIGDIDKRVIAGQKGETKVSRTLLLHQRMEGIEGEAFDDFCFEVGKSGSCEIDCLYVSTIGIFVIEVKNWIGKIFASKDGKMWTQVYFKGKEPIKVTHYNPLKQNEGHIKCVKNLLNKDYPIYSIVAFAQNNAPMLGEPSLMNYNQIVSYVDSIKRKNQNISIKDVQSLIALFKVVRKKYSVAKNKHIENIQNLHK